MKVNLKICLYLQTKNFKKKNSFDKAMMLVKKYKPDILVFPEDCYVPFSSELNKIDLDKSEDRKHVMKRFREFSKELQCAIVVSIFDQKKRFYSVFANARAKLEETSSSIYIKHTATSCSAFEFEDYSDQYEKEIFFEPIVFKGYRLGMTICYDCTNAAFSRMYGRLGVDVILNSTGGDVDYTKWFRYNQVRAIENHCYSFVTMGGRDDKKKNFVYGFNRNGGNLPPILLNDEVNKKIVKLYWKVFQEDCIYMI